MYSSAARALTTASIPTKFCSAIKIGKHTSLVAPGAKSALYDYLVEFQDGVWAPTQIIAEARDP